VLRYEPATLRAEKSWLRLAFAVSSG